MTQNNHTDELYHYGRKGMRWGQHIFGKEPTGSSGSRRKKSSNSVTKSIKTALDNRKKKREEAARAEQTKKNLKGTPKSAKNMTTEELGEAIKHLEMEQRYNNLVAQTSTVSKGKQFATSFFERAVIPGVTQAGSKLIEQSIMKLGKKYLGLDEESVKSIKDQAADAKAQWEKEYYTGKLNDLKGGHKSSNDKTGSNNKSSKTDDSNTAGKTDKDGKAKKNNENNTSKKEKTETYTPGPDDIFDAPSGSHSTKPGRDRSDTIDADWSDNDSYDSGQSAVNRYVNNDTKLLPSGNNTQLALGSSYIDDLFK